MKFGLAMGVVSAVGAHAVFLLFGGLLFLDDKEGQGHLVKVDLISAAEAEAEKEKELEPTEPTERVEDIETEEPPPDAEEVVRELALTAEASKQRMEAVSLSAIEAALSGRGGPGDGGGFSFDSGGSLSGLAGPGGFEKKLEEAFTMGEIDQKPRVVFQTAPLYPSEMRGRKEEGLVTVIFVVDATGRVTVPKVESSSNKAFEKPALDAVKQWKFEPAVKGGQRVACKMRAPIRFQPS